MTDGPRESIPSGNTSDDETEKKISFNSNVLNKNEETYKLEAFKKNYLLVFNNKNVKAYKPRLGNNKDVEELTNTFSKYGFEVQVLNDNTKAEISEALTIFKEKDFTDYGCIAVAVLTYGSYDGMLWAKDELYSEKDILHYFKTHDKPTLITKPKLLFIQAPIPEEVADISEETVCKDTFEGLEPYMLPIESDILIFHSSYMGNPFHNEELNGSWFILTLCRKIERLSPAVDVLSITRAVRQAVSHDMEHGRSTATGVIDENNQIPLASSTLIRKLYLKKYIDSELLCNFCNSSTNELEDQGVYGSETIRRSSYCCVL